jgi:hypothetical protein
MIAEAKAYLYGAILVALLGAFMWYTIHERTVEHAKDMAAIAALTQSAQRKDANIEAAESAALTPIGVDYHAKLAAAPDLGLGLVCHDPVRPGPVSGPASDRPGANAAADGDVGPPYDPSGPALTRAEQADAQIIGLQQTITVLLHAMQKAHSP